MEGRLLHFHVQFHATDHVNHDLSVLPSTRSSGVDDEPRETKAVGSSGVKLAGSEDLVVLADRASGKAGTTESEVAGLGAEAGSDGALALVGAVGTGEAEGAVGGDEDLLTAGDHGAQAEGVAAA